MKYKLPIILLISILTFISCSNSDNIITQRHPKKCLILGNSITLHGTCSYWWGIWGMAASTKENDFVHKLENKIKTHYKNFSCTPVNIANWETSLNIDSINFTNLNISDYDYIVIRLGENISNNIETMACEKAIKELITSIKERNGSTKLYITGVFWPNTSKETAIKNVATSENIIYINIDKIYSDVNIQKVGNQVFGDDGQLHIINHDGVAAHPNDSGMEAIAEEIYKAMFP